VRGRARVVVLLVAVPLVLIVVRFVATHELRTIDPELPTYMLAAAVFLGGGLLAGFVLSWWGLLAAVGFACYLVYATELNPLGIFWALVGGLAACGAVIGGSLLRRRMW
jgi:hypothetical protein